MIENHNLRIADKLGTQQHEACLLKTIHLFMELQEQRKEKWQCSKICRGHCWGSLWSTVRRQWPQHRREQPQNSLDDGNIGNVLLLMHQTFPQNRREYPHWDQFISPRHCSLLVVVGYPQWKYKQYRLQWKPSVMRLVGKTSGAFWLELPWFAWKLRQRILVWWV